MLRTSRLSALVSPVLRAAAWCGLLAACLGQGMITPDLPALPAPAYDSNQFVELLPGLRTARAPEWVRPGLRVTYYSSASSGGGRHGSAGHGFTQVNVAAMNPNATVLDVRSYGLQGLEMTSPVLLIGGDSAVSVPGAGADWWLNPAVLQQVKEGQYGAEGESVVIRMPCTVAGKTYNALRFQYECRGSRISYMYDLASGLLLQSNTATGHPGRQMLTHNSFVGLRYLQLPWAAAGRVAWPGTFNVMNYRGTITVLVPGVPATAMPMTAQAQITARGPDWVRHTVTSSFTAMAGMPPNTSVANRVSGLAQIGGVWLPPAALRTLRGGQVIDQDPSTKITTTVSYVGNGPTGAREVVISEVSQVQRLDYAYDLSSGLLVGLYKADTPLYTRTQMRLTGVQ